MEKTSCYAYCKANVQQADYLIYVDKLPEDTFNDHGIGLTYVIR